LRFLFMSDDERTLKLYQNLFQITVRAFYDETAIPIVDYMILNCKASMTEDQLEQSTKLPIKKIRGAFQKMKEDEIIREDALLKRWTLTSNIKELLQQRLAFIKLKIAERIAATNIKKYKCTNPNCKEVHLPGVMALYQGKCPNCKGDLIEMERDSNAYIKLKDLVQTIEGKYIEACRGRDFPAKMYPEEYHKLWESENKGPGYQLPILFASDNEKPLFKRVLEKLNESKKGKSLLKIEDSVLAASTSLQEFYKQHPTKIDGRIITTGDLLNKRKSLEDLGEKEYQEEYLRNIKKLFK